MDWPGPQGCYGLTHHECKPVQKNKDSDLHGPCVPHLALLLYACVIWTLNTNLKRESDPFGNKHLHTIIDTNSDSVLNHQLFHDT